MSKSDEMRNVAHADQNMRQTAGDLQTLTWRSPTEPPFRLHGFPWYATDRVFRRLPIEPPSPVRDALDRLSNCTAGGQIHFQTDSRLVGVRVQLSAPATMDHMTTVAECGFDAYFARPDAFGQLRFLGVTRIPRDAVSFEKAFLKFDSREMRRVVLNFPLYQGVREILVGVEPDAEIQPPPPLARAGRVVCYGTSIVQGGCACRPGMNYPNILSRRFNMEFINMGFSGNARGDLSIAEAIATIPDPACVLLDYEANCKERAWLTDTLRPFIGILRGAHSTVPILVLSRIPFPRILFRESDRIEKDARRDFIAQTVSDLREEGDPNVHFLDGGALLGEADWDECTVDGLHPTDLGFMRMADRLEPVMRTLLRA